MTRHQLRHQLRHRLPDRRDDTGSMAFFLVLAIVGLAVAALLVPMIITTSQATRSDTSRTHAVDAAQAGLNVMIGEIRAAQTGGVGTSTKLPCHTPTRPLSGSVDSVGEAAYRVSIDYFTVDPVKAPTTQKMTCVDGYGTYDPVSSTFTPKFARITSVGTDGVARSGSTPGRTLKATYVFKTTNSNTVGGRIRTGSNNQLCWDAGSPQPAASTPVFLRACTTPPSDQQLFAYRNDLTIQLLSSITPTYPDGLCMSTAAPPVAGNAVTLVRCQPLGSPPYSQVWSYNDDGGYTAALATSSTTGVLAGVCMSVASVTTGAQVVLAGCNGGAATQDWNPDAAVGAGAAQELQLVNFFEFGRCLDVTNQNPNIDHLIDYPCKQNPFPAAVRWNQKFSTPGIPSGATSATGRISTTRDVITYCLTSPRTETGLVVVNVCNGSAEQNWTVYGAAPTLPYSTKYTIVDASGRCLGLTAPRPGETWSAIDVETCTGATEQKWNAAADLSAPVLQDVDEPR